MMPQFVYGTKNINEPKRLSRSARILLTSKRDTLNAGKLLALLCSSPTTHTEFGWLRAGKIGLEMMTRVRSTQTIGYCVRKPGLEPWDAPDPKAERWKPYDLSHTVTEGL